jgi:reverse gyrase
VAFKPDDWQRRLLDIADSGNSALIVAPTASGKTFIAYYVMEMCLRANDSDVVIYVAPTAALVDQVVASICVCVCACINLCMYVCVYIYIYIFIFICRSERLSLRVMSWACA